MSDQVLTGAEIFAKSLRAQGCDLVFGNPGTTELPILDAISREGLQYVLALQETSAVAMADGYAQAARKPAVVNLHTIGGLGHAMGAIVNAQIANSPVIVTAGQQDRRHIQFDPLLYGDAVALARSVVKYSIQVESPDDIQSAVDFAFKTAMTPPRGPVFLSLPQDCMMAPARMSPTEEGPEVALETSSNLKELAGELLGYPAGRLAIVVCEDLHWAKNNCIPQISSLLEAPVFGASWPGHIPFPTAHVNWRGCLNPNFADIQKTLQAFSGLLVVGSHPFIAYGYSDCAPTTSSQKIYQLTADSSKFGKYFPIELGLVGDLDLSLPELARELSSLARVQKENAGPDIVPSTETFVEGEFTPSTVAHELVRAIGPDVMIVDEAPVIMNEIRRYLHSWLSSQYVFTRSAILGWAMPAAIGTSLAIRKPVVCLVGDGSAMYAPQALWTAAKLNVPVTFVVLNNRAYGILKNSRGSSNFRSAEHLLADPLELTNPIIDFIALSESMGINARRIKSVSDIGSSIQYSISAMQPQLFEIVLS